MVEIRTRTLRHGDLRVRKHIHQHTHTLHCPLHLSIHPPFLILINHRLIPLLYSFLFLFTLFFYLFTPHTLTLPLVLQPFFLSLSVSAPAPSIYNLFGFSVPNLCLRAREVVAFYTEKGAPSLLKYPRFPKLGSLAGH